MTAATCLCGHERIAHVYEYGSCRPGYKCPDECRAYRPNAVTLTDQEKDAILEPFSGTKLTGGSTTRWSDLFAAVESVITARLAADPERNNR